MPVDPTPAAWERLGGMLEQRRVELNPQYKNLARFAEERDLNYRLCWDIESGRRTNYRRPTRRAIEVAYGLPPGAIDHALAGGDFPQAGRREDDPAAELMRRLDLGQSIEGELRESLKRIVTAHLERKAAGQERRRA